MSPRSPKHSIRPSKLATQHRQKGITLLEKICKNMFKMFRDHDTTRDHIVEKFDELKKQLDVLDDLVLTGEYHREMMIYVDQLSHTLHTDFDLDDLRGSHLTKLNRIQKLKNKGGYKRKEKHKKDSKRAMEGL